MAEASQVFLRQVLNCQLRRRGLKFFASGNVVSMIPDRVDQIVKRAVVLRWPVIVKKFITYSTYKVVVNITCDLNYIRVHVTDMFGDAMARELMRDWIETVNEKAAWKTTDIRYEYTPDLGSVTERRVTYGR